MKYRWDINHVRVKVPTQRKAKINRALTVAYLITVAKNHPEEFTKLLGIVVEVIDKSGWSDSTES